jgi:HK97 gp10 family phage protein
MAKGTLTFKGLEDWMEQLAEAGESVDEAVTELLGDTQPFIEEELIAQLRKTSEAYTGETASTIQVSGVQQEGNYLYVEATVGGSDAPQATYKEYGTTRQAAEPFVRPTFRGHRLKNKLKEGMTDIIQRMDLQ